MYFDGKGAMAIAPSGSFDIDSTRADAFSVDCDIRTTAGGFICGMRSDIGTGFALYLTSAGLGLNAVGENGVHLDIVPQSAVAVMDGKWHHLHVYGQWTAQPDTFTVSFIVDTKLVHSTSMSDALHVLPSELFVGNRRSGIFPDYGSPFNGCLRALTFNAKFTATTKNTKTEGGGAITTQCPATMLSGAPRCAHCGKATRNAPRYVSYY
jgi:hypothetical protein